MSYWLVVIVVAVASVLGAGPSSAQSTDETLRALQQDVRALRQGQQKLERDLQEIKNLLRRRGAAAAAPAGPPKDFALSLEGHAMRGAPAAKVVLVDFTDYQ